jgi:hypothetical protein
MQEVPFAKAAQSTARCAILLEGGAAMLPPMQFAVMFAIMARFLLMG